MSSHLSKESCGYIYCIINNENGKRYVGKTTGDDENKLYRWRQHVLNAKRGSIDCPKLYNAIRKYGEDSFSFNVILNCPKDEVDLYEIVFIDLHKTTSDEYGYNISAGGDGILMTEEIRKLIFDGQNREGIVNIHKRIRKGQHVGYRVTRTQGGVSYDKMFSSSKYSLEENLQKAIEYLQDLKNNKVDDYTPRNKESKLPSQIYKDHEGYRFQIKLEGTTYCKSFTDSALSMDEKLKLAIQAKEEYAAKYTHPKDAKIAINIKTLPKNITVVRKGGNEIGYKFAVDYNYKVYSKTFAKSSMPMDEKLKLALSYKDEFFQNNPALLRAGSDY